MARKPRKTPAKKKSPEAIKAAADRAEARAKGASPAQPTTPIDPPIVTAEEIVVVEKKKTGAPALPFSQEIADEICDYIANGPSLRSYVLQPGKPSRTTIYKWLAENPAFADQYARAREDQAESHADEMLDVARSEEDPARARLIIDTMKWTASKLKPRKYGDFKAIELTGRDGGPIEIEDRGDLDTARRVALALGRALERQRLAMKTIDAAE